MTDARLAGLQTQVAVVVDPATIAARLAGLQALVAVYIVPKPSSVTATQISSTQIDLTWATPIDGKTLLRYEVQIDGGAPINKGSSTSHSFTGLTAYSTHEVGVRFLDTDGNISDWEHRGLALIAAPADLSFNGTPWFQLDPVETGLRRWRRTDFVGVGKEIQYQPDFVGSVLRTNNTLVVQGGVTKQVEIGTVLSPVPIITKLSGQISNGSTSSAGVVSSAPQLPLDVGTYRFKMMILGRSNTVSNEGMFWPELVSGTVSRFLWTEVYQTTGTAAVDGRPFAVTTATARLVEGRAARAANVGQNQVTSYLNATDEFLWVARGIVVVTASPAVLGLRIRNGVGGGNTNISFAGTHITARKVA